uniref:Uncharacterized protein n=1 Tax=Cacopsylla melanoneura TaxID=428564 RepID=A0A8D8X1W4_9HEMI
MIPSSHSIRSIWIPTIILIGLKLGLLQQHPPNPPDQAQPLWTHTKSLNMSTFDLPCSQSTSPNSTPNITTSGFTVSSAKNVSRANTNWKCIKISTTWISSVLVVRRIPVQNGMTGCMIRTV